MKAKWCSLPETESQQG